MPNSCSVAPVHHPLSTPFSYAGHGYRPSVQIRAEIELCHRLSNPYFITLPSAPQSVRCDTKLFCELCLCEGEVDGSSSELNQS